MYKRCINDSKFWGFEHFYTVIYLDIISHKSKSSVGFLMFCNPVILTCV